MKEDFQRKADTGTFLQYTKKAFVFIMILRRFEQCLLEKKTMRECMQLDHYILPVCWKRQVENIMINFEEELKKFHPSLEIEDAEEAIYNQDLTDMADILVAMLKDVKEEE